MATFSMTTLSRICASVQTSFNTAISPKAPQDTTQRGAANPAPWRQQVPSILIVCTVCLLASANLIDVYGSIAVWSVAAAPAAICGVLVVLAGSFPAMRLWWQLAFLLIAQFVVGPVVALNETTLFHILPTLETLTRGWEMTFGSFKLLIALSPPVDTSHGSLMAVWTLALWATFLAGSFAVLPNGKHAAFALIPLTVTITASALLGTADGVMRISTGIAATVLALIWVSWRLDAVDVMQRAKACGIVILATNVALCGCAAVASHRFILRDVYDPPLTLDEMTSPLSGMRAYIAQHKDDTLLSVENLPAGSSVRLAVMDYFDGTVWNCTDTSYGLHSVHTDDTAPEGTSFTATFTVHKELNDLWLPLAGSATDVTFDDIGNDNAQQFHYSTASDTGLLVGGVDAGTRYVESGVIPATPTAEQINNAHAATASSASSTGSAGFTSSASSIALDDYSTPIQSTSPAFQRKSFSTATSPTNSTKPVVSTVLYDSASPTASHGSAEPISSGTSIASNDSVSPMSSANQISSASSIALADYAIPIRSASPASQHNSASPVSRHNSVSPATVSLTTSSTDTTSRIHTSTQHIPDAIKDLAVSLAGGQTTDGTKARVLAEELRTMGRFSHGLAGEYPSPPGHGSYRLNMLLSSEVMVGDSEQYASAMALMARELGLASRVVLGFVPKDEHGGISEARTEQRSDGSTHIAFTGNDIDAWVEINLDGYGWVAFHPTPDETATPDDPTSSPPEPQELIRQPPVPLTDPPREDIQPRGQSSVSGQDAVPPPDMSLWKRIGSIIRTIAIYGSPVWAMMLVCGTILLSKTLHLRWLRRHGTPRQRIAQGWHAILLLADTMAIHGKELPETRRDQAIQLADGLHLNATLRSLLQQLAHDADQAAFCHRPVDSKQTDNYWNRINRARTALLSTLPRHRRWRALLSLPLHSIRHRSTAKRTYRIN